MTLAMTTPATNHPRLRTAGALVAGFVTVSAGIASTTLSAYADAESMLSAADAALYEAKRAGRNQVAWAAAPDTEAMS